MTFRTDATIDQVGPGRRLQWRAAARQASCRVIEVVEGRLLEPLLPLGPLVAWLLHCQTAGDLRRLEHLLDTAATSGPTQEGTAI
jgi:hypothetical protein